VNRTSRQVTAARPAVPGDAACAEAAVTNVTDPFRVRCGSAACTPGEGLAGERPSQHREVEVGERAGAGPAAHGHHKVVDLAEAVEQRVELTAVGCLDLLPAHRRERATACATLSSERPATTTSPPWSASRAGCLADAGGATKHGNPCSLQVHLFPCA